MVNIVLAYRDRVHFNAFIAHTSLYYIIKIYILNVNFYINSLFYILYIFLNTRYFNNYII